MCQMIKPFYTGFIYISNTISLRHGPINSKIMCTRDGITIYLMQKFNNYVLSVIQELSNNVTQSIFWVMRNGYTDWVNLDWLNIQYNDSLLVYSFQCNLWLFKTHISF